MYICHLMPSLFICDIFNGWFNVRMDVHGLAPYQSINLEQCKGMQMKYIFYISIFYIYIYGNKLHMELLVRKFYLKVLQGVIYLSIQRSQMWLIFLRNGSTRSLEKVALKWYKDFISQVCMFEQCKLPSIANELCMLVWEKGSILWWNSMRWKFKKLHGYIENLDCS